MVFPERIDDGTQVTAAGFRKVTHKQFRLAGDRVFAADVMGADNARAAAIIALTADNKIVIAKQFRFGPEKVLNELPGGMVDSTESPQQAAIRELKEETGYVAAEVVYLGAVHVDAWDNTEHHYFLGIGCTQASDPSPEDDENIEVALLDIEDFIQGARQGNMTDAHAVFLAYEKLQQLKQGEDS